MNEQSYNFFSTLPIGVGITDEEVEPARYNPVTFEKAQTKQEKRRTKMKTHDSIKLKPWSVPEQLIKEYAFLQNIVKVFYLEKGISKTFHDEQEIFIPDDYTVVVRRYYGEPHSEYERITNPDTVYWRFERMVKIAQAKKKEKLEKQIEKTNAAVRVRTTANTHFDLNGYFAEENYKEEQLTTNDKQTSYGIKVQAITPTITKSKRRAGSRVLGSGSSAKTTVGHLSNRAINSVL